MRLTYLAFLILFGLSCNFHNQKETMEEDAITEVQSNELVIIFNKREKNTEFINRATSAKESFQFWREGFDPPFEDPNLHISVFHGLDQGKKKILRKELDEMEVWFDSEMGYSSYAASPEAAFLA